ncbi:FecR family protein [Chitinophaga sp. CF118]|uniref:FecR family protein n=1 Tax=Chitinophaga sp. CF118 TaxID=1884367 RepID=UPI0008E58A8F|nr:FecR domain-containing protein [Chitinophaga sp. CF118]SFF01123.1 FecR family protein [Chitinophaga sp. CF118]
MSNEDIQEFVIDCLADPDNRDKQTALAQWLQESEENQVLYAETKRIWDMAEEIPATPFSTAEGWAALSQQISTPVKVKRLFPWRSVAAVLLPLCIATAFWWQHNTNNRNNDWTSFTAHGSEKDSLLLPDGSVIYAKPGTTLAYNKERVVKLQKGEAFFEVVKNEQIRFVIDLEKGKVTVLGTSFNIKVGTTVTDVTVLDGKISMNADNSETPVVLTKGETGRLDASAATVNKIPGNYSYNCGWVNGDFAFKNEEAATVAAVLSEYYHTEIKIDDSLRKRRITVKFSNSSIEEVKAVLAEVLDK